MAFGVGFDDMLSLDIIMSFDMPSFAIMLFAAVLLLLIVWSVVDICATAAVDRAAAATPIKVI
ncbi:MAG: hypothetical protein K2P79_10810 [Sphingomonas sp.]|nr:hypothetical protein [Sphingomonas sp.]